VVQYYSHNGGWFIGQPNGCPAGGRARVLWALHDAHDGRVLSWGEVGVQTRTPYYYSPNAAELQDYLMTVERELMLRIERQLAP
jgi:hypothetical protein